MFIKFDPSQCEDEARERWGETEAYEESVCRVANYGEEEWREIKAEAEDIEALSAELKRSGQPADGEPARVVAEQARLRIDRWFYPCSRAIAPGARRDVRRRPPVRGELREGRAGADGLCPRRDRRERVGR